MANPWFRLWTDMVNDPKWRTIARKSNQRIGDVISVYMHMMTAASNATERGRTQGWSDEDVATALDLETSDVSKILEAMQGRVLDGDYLTGWEKRQPKREDDSASRSKKHRETQKEIALQTQPNATDHKNTLDKIREDKKLKPLSNGVFENFWLAYPKKVAKQDAEKAFAKLNPDAELQAKILQAVTISAKLPDWLKESGQFIPNAATWLNGKRWEDFTQIKASENQNPSPKAGDTKIINGRKLTYNGTSVGWAY